MQAKDPYLKKIEGRVPSPAATPGSAPWGDRVRRAAIRRSDLSWLLEQGVGPEPPLQIDRQEGGVVVQGGGGAAVAQLLGDQRQGHPRLSQRAAQDWRRRCGVTATR